MHTSSAILGTVLLPRETLPLAVEQVYNQRVDELRAAVRRYRRIKAAERGAWEHLQTATTAAIAAGLSQSAAAEVVGVDRMTIRKWMGNR